MEALAEVAEEVDQILYFHVVYRRAPPTIIGLVHLSRILMVFFYNQSGIVWSVQGEIARRRFLMFRPTKQTYQFLFPFFFLV